MTISDSFTKEKEMAKIISFFTKLADTLVEAREMQTKMKEKYPHV
jgi:hypothetical protein